MSELDADDTRFLRRLMRRDEAAFTALVERYKGMVYGVCVRFVRDHAEAEDLAQDVFVAVFKTIDRFRAESSLTTWIYQIALNLSRNRLRAWQRRYASAHESFDHDVHAGALFEFRAHAGAAQVDDPLRHAMESERASQLDRALGRLDEPYREVLILRDLEDLDYDQIAVVLGVAVGTVKSRLFRARAALRQCLEVDREER